jgi:hypothetical protein
MAGERKYPTTGFWIFVCNTSQWEGDRWLAKDESELFYKISKHHRADFRPGQLGVLRLNDDRRSKADRGTRPPIKAGIYAIVETLGIAEYRADPDVRFYREPEKARGAAWRVRLRVVANLLDHPVLASRLPHEEDFAHIHRPLQTATLALKESAFSHIVALAGVTIGGSEAEDTLVNTPSGIRFLESKYLSATPEAKRRMSLRIERGSVGKQVKKLRQGRCQVCEALGENPIAFIDQNGQPFAEAHHVVPVSQMKAGSLSYLNIMVLCPNHHRQAHYGAFEVVAESNDAWMLRVDGQDMPITKAKL